MDKTVNLGKVVGEDAKINGVNNLNINTSRGIKGIQNGSEYSISLDTDEVPTRNSYKALNSGAIYNALEGKANASDVPTKTSQLTNDSEFITANDKVAKAGLAENIPVNPTSTTGLNIWIET